MAFKSIIEGDEELGGDAWYLTKLATGLGAKMSRLCMEKTLYDGREDIPESTLPKGVAQESFPIYQRFRSLGRTNMAQPVVDAVTDRQRPNGFRVVGASEASDTTADDEYTSCRMAYLIPKVNHYVALHGEGFYFVTAPEAITRVSVLSPFVCHMSADEESVVVYQYDEVNEQEKLTLYRRIVDGENVEIRMRVAVKESESRTLVGEDDDALVKEWANAYDTADERTWTPGTGWKWDTASERVEYATTAAALPIFRQSSPDGKGQLSPNFDSFMRIDQGIFNRLCIITMQAFRQRGVKNLKSTTYQADDPAVQAGLAQEGDPIDYNSLFAIGPAALWLMPADVDVWESKTTDFTPLLTSVKDDIKQLAMSTKTPLDILSPDVAGSASAADNKREGITFKVDALNRLANDAIVSTMRMALVADGHNDALEKRYAMQWLAPELRTWGDNLGQTASYLKGILPLKSIWTIVLGLTEQEIAEAEQNLSDESFNSLLQNLSDEETPTPENQVDSSTEEDGAEDLDPLNLTADSTSAEAAEE